MGHFSGKTAVITGAGSGIGRALAEALAREGARLALSDIDESAVKATLGMLPATTDAKSYRLDVTSRGAVFAHADQVKADFGTAHLLFNNAGSAMLGTFEHQTIEEIQWMVDLDLWSVVYATKAFLPMMLAQREGWIVNISSIAGLIGFPALSAYNIAKFGVRGLTESLWSELEGTGVNAVCVHPGGIRTNIERASRRCANAGPIEARADARQREDAADQSGALRAGHRQWHSTRPAQDHHGLSLDLGRLARAIASRFIPGAVQPRIPGIRGTTWKRTTGRTC